MFTCPFWPQFDTALIIHMGFLVAKLNQVLRQRYRCFPLQSSGVQVALLSCVALFLPNRASLAHGNTVVHSTVTMVMVVAVLMMIMKKHDEAHSCFAPSSPVGNSIVCCRVWLWVCIHGGGVECKAKPAQTGQRAPFQQVQPLVVGSYLDLADKQAEETGWGCEFRAYTVRSWVCAWPRSSSQVACCSHFVSVHLCLAMTPQGLSESPGGQGQ